MLAMCNEGDNSKFESEQKVFVRMVPKKKRSSSDGLFIRLPPQDVFYPK